MQRIETEIKKSIYKNFHNYLSYAFLTGSYVIGDITEGKSDIDFCIVLNEKIRNESNKKVKNKIYHFILDYLRIHQDYHLVPDLLFPGVEIFTLTQVKDILMCRGFSLKDGKMYFNKLKDMDFLNNINIWYRAWLGMHCWSKYLIGDKALFLENRKECCKAILKLFLLNIPTELDKLSFYEEIRKKDAIWKSFGVKEKEKPFIIKKYFFPYFKNFTLRKRSDIKKEIIIINKKELLDWERQVIEVLKIKKFSSSSIFSLNELKEFSALAKLYNKEGCLYK